MVAQRVEIEVDLVVRSIRLADTNGAGTERAGVWMPTEDQLERALVTVDGANLDQGGRVHYRNYAANLHTALRLVLAERPSPVLCPHVTENRRDDGGEVRCERPWGHVGMHTNGADLAQVQWP
jgi:hypothetical protein